MPNYSEFIDWERECVCEREKGRSRKGENKLKLRQPTGYIF